MQGSDEMKNRSEEIRNEKGIRQEDFARLMDPVKPSVLLEMKDIIHLSKCRSSRADLFPPSHTTVRAVRHTAVQYNFKACRSL